MKTKMTMTAKSGNRDLKYIGAVNMYIVTACALQEINSK